MAVSKLSKVSATNAFTKYPNFWDKTTTAPVYESIATLPVTTANNSVTMYLQSIPQDYMALQLRYYAKNNYTVSGGAGSIWIRFNQDTGSNYFRTDFYSNGTSLTLGYGVSTNTGIIIGAIPRNSVTSTVFCSGVYNIFDYANTSKNTSIIGYGGYSCNGATEELMRFSSGVWMNTSAVTTIEIFSDSGVGFTAGSHFALYGMRA